MDRLVRNKTTASEAMELESGAMNPFYPEKQHTQGYLDELQKRRQTLPVCGLAQRQRFLDAYQSEKSQVTVVTGETGSGKTTQLAKTILFDEFASGLRVACTQPSQVATIGVAARVALEMDVGLGTLVGYKVRFDNTTSRKTRLAFLTDGLVLRQYEQDPSLSNYACIIIDEVHERTANIDMLLALVKKSLATRHDLKVVIMSATIDLEKFRRYFNTANVFEASRQVHSVDIKHVDTAPILYETAIQATVRHIVSRPTHGHILIFMTHSSEIERMCLVLQKNHPSIRAVPLYSSLPKHDQDLAIGGSGTLTYCGLKKEAGYNYRVGMSTLLTAPISQDSARQRAGRAGRTQSGEVYRLYTKEFHDNSMSKHTPPGVHMREVSGVVLRLKSLGFHDVTRFDWFDPPHPEAYLRAIGDLEALGYIDNRCRITPNGRQAAVLPVHCAWYNCLLKAHELGCLGQMITIAAVMSLQDDILSRPHEVRYAADVMRKCFGHGESDPLVRLNAIHCYIQMKKDLSTEHLVGWCNEYFVNHEVAKQVISLRSQLRDLVVKAEIVQDRSEILSLNEEDEEYSAKIRQALLAGFFMKAGMRTSNDTYKTARDNHIFLLDPQSCLIGMNYQWVICLDLHYSGVQYMRMVTAVEPEWLIEYPLFSDDQLPKDYFGKFKNPRMKACLDDVRQKMGQ
ncbi:pre-mrna splicing factor rna helicase [Fusarium albosuccineum]|uniref:Pre-mrna splicing factor rna helicase n=1 Tax=Fusarium albosuccineum TaxID=1237068 RepID=A0A8H4L9A1_9HYPO|nr:pre-mrna splicing factor rna helicase [Fusarium albosuccineum]